MTDDKFSNMTADKLGKLSVKELRKYITTNKIFKGISNLKKKELIDDILVSKFWRDNYGDKKIKNDIKNKKRKKETEIKDLETALKKKQLLQNKLRLCESRLKKKDKLLLEKNIEILEKAPTKKNKENAERDLIEMVENSSVKLPDVKEDTKPNNIKFDKDSLLIELIPKLDGLKDDDLGGLNDKQKKIEEKIEIIADKISSVPPPPKIPPPPPPKLSKTIDTQTETPNTNEISTQTHESPPNTEGVLTHKDERKKTIDNGHTIINMYCGGNHHPDYPIPQSLVRSALNVNQQPLNQQKDMSDFLRQESVNFENFKRQQQKQPTMGDIQSKFNKPAKKFEPVKTIKPNKPIDFSKKENVKKEDDKKSAFDDDSDEEEDEVEKMRRLKREEVAKETGKSKGKGFSEAFKKRLEEKLGARK